MPGLNGTGPAGQGPSTGRGMGNCNTSDQEGNQSRPFFRRLGLGRRFGSRRMQGQGLGQGLGQGQAAGQGMGRGAGNGRRGGGGFGRKQNNN